MDYLTNWVKTELATSIICTFCNRVCDKDHYRGITYSSGKPFCGHCDDFLGESKTCHCCGTLATHHPDQRFHFNYDERKMDGKPVKVPVGNWCQVCGLLYCKDCIDPVTSVILEELYICKSCSCHPVNRELFLQEWVDFVPLNRDLYLMRRYILKEHARKYGIS